MTTSSPSTVPPSCGVKVWVVPDAVGRGAARRRRPRWAPSGDPGAPPQREPAHRDAVVDQGADLLDRERRGSGTARAASAARGCRRRRRTGLPAPARAAPRACFVGATSSCGRLRGVGPRGCEHGGACPERSREETISACEASAGSCSRSRPRGWQPRYFEPRENLTGTSPEGLPAAVYEVSRGGDDRVRGQLRVWSDGAQARYAADDEEVVDLHLAIELENNGEGPLEVVLGSLQVEELSLAGEPQPPMAPVDVAGAARVRWSDLAGRRRVRPRAESPATWTGSPCGLSAASTGASLGRSPRSRRSAPLRPVVHGRSDLSGARGGPRGPTRGRGAGPGVGASAPAAAARASHLRPAGSFVARRPSSAAGARWRPVGVRPERCGPLQAVGMRAKPFAPFSLGAAAPRPSCSSPPSLKWTSRNQQSR